MVHGKSSRKRVRLSTAAEAKSEKFVDANDAFITISDFARFCEVRSKKKRKHDTKNSTSATATAWIKLLEQGFGDRVLSITDDNPYEDDVEVMEDFVIGLRLNPDNYHRLIDRGPSANTSEAKEFRELWGDKSEMRKFADGSICETVVWFGNSMMQRRRIVESIAKYLLQRHFSIPPDCVQVAQNTIESVLLTSPSFSACKIETTGEEQFRALCECYGGLGSMLRSLDGLPLTLARIQPMSPSLRHTEIFPPVSTNCSMAKACVYVRGDSFVPRPSGLYAPPWRPSHEVQITLEASGKWPENVQAIRQLKCAFYLKMGNLLREQFQLRSQALEDGLLVSVESHIFRIVIVYAREVALLKLKKDERGMLISRNNKESVAFELATTHASHHAGQILGVVHAYASFSLTCRLARRWICCHMLSDFLRLEAIELLVSSLYLNADGSNVPGSAFAGFMKFLRLLAEHNWLTAPVIINFNGELTGEHKEEILTKFVSLRPTLPPMCLITPNDHVGSRWSRPQPTAMIMERICNLAKASLDILELNAFQLSETIMHTIFQPAMDVYDALIWLRGRRIPKRYMAFGQLKKEKKEQPSRNDDWDDRFPVTDFDPTSEYLRVLREKFDRYALFFYDSSGGNAIGVLWRPRVTRVMEEKVSGNHVKEDNIDKTSQKIPEISVMLNEIALLGKGLVKKVDNVRNLEN